LLEHVIIGVFGFFARLGGLGLLGLGVLDSSFLFMPLGNDLLVVAFTVRNPHRLPYYVVMAAIGSVLGSLIVDLTSRKLGESGLADRVPKRRLEFVKHRFEKRAAVSLLGASLMPPPFPFTVFVIVAAALQYSRKRLVAAIAAGRVLRFTIVGLLAVFYGRQIIRMSKLPAVRWVIIGLAVISIVGSALSIIQWFQRSRSAPSVPQESNA
jgi:membrane protein YqaA with SNARE-associated domain